MASDDPDFETKAADVIGLYPNPPAHAHKTKAVDEFLAKHLNVRLHYTPTYPSWLNQVEIWFAKIERDVIARGIFSSVPDLKRKLMRYIRQYNLAPKPVKWVHRDPAHRITTDSRVRVH